MVVSVNTERLRRAMGVALGGWLRGVWSDMVAGGRGFNSDGLQNGPPLTFRPALRDSPTDSSYGTLSMFHASCFMLHASCPSWGSAPESVTRGPGGIFPQLQTTEKSCITINRQNVAKRKPEWGCAVESRRLSEGRCRRHISPEAKPSLRSKWLQGCEAAHKGPHGGQFACRRS